MRQFVFCISFLSLCPNHLGSHPKLEAAEKTFSFCPIGQALSTSMYSSLSHILLTGFLSKTSLEIIRRQIFWGDKWQQFFLYSFGDFLWRYNATFSSEIYVRSVSRWFPESVNNLRYALRRGCVIKTFFIALSFCKYFCFRSFHPSLTWFAVAGPPFIFLSWPCPFSVIAISWNRLPIPWKA
jgi:hypothetical protein